MAEEYEVPDVPAIMLAKPPIPAAVCCLPGPPFFFTFILPQSCQELQTLQGLPSGPMIRPGGKLGWVSRVVRRGWDEGLTVGKSGDMVAAALKMSRVG